MEGGGSSTGIGPGGLAVAAIVSTTIPMTALKQQLQGSSSTAGQQQKQGSTTSTGQQQQTLVVSTTGRQQTLVASTTGQQQQAQRVSTSTGQQQQAQGVSTSTGPQQQTQVVVSTAEQEKPESSVSVTEPMEVDESVDEMPVKPLLSPLTKSNDPKLKSWPIDQKVLLVCVLTAVCKDESGPLTAKTW
jgi:hypothetical protein